MLAALATIESARSSLQAFGGNRLNNSTTDSVRMDWLKALDLPRALGNVEKDVIGDWYRDPWGWPELAFVAHKSPQLAVARLDDSGACRVLKLDVVKENFVVRPAVVLDPLDRLCYQALVDSLSKKLIGDMGGWAYGWRLPRTDPKTGEYISNSTEWGHYRERLRLLAKSFSCGLTTDVVSFFASMPISKLMEDVRAVAGKGKPIDRLESFLQGAQTTPGRSGLPQRCWASSVLAHFYLASVDDLVRRHAPTLTFFVNPSPAAVRWMDDVWVFESDSMKLRLFQLELQDLLNRKGLRLNAGKTELFCGDALLKEALQIEHSAVDSALAEPASNAQPLDEMIQGLLASPETASRTAVRFATTRMRKHKEFGRVDDFVGIAARMPQASDHLARLFRDSDTWKRLQDWYINLSRDYSRSLTWSTYHLGTMFPSDEHPGPSLVRYWADELSNGTLPPLHAPLAAQRLSAWDAPTARGAIRAAAQRPAYDHPFVIRALAFAGRSADIPATEVRQLLQQYPETDVSLRYLEAEHMRPPKATADFAGA